MDSEAQQELEATLAARQELGPAHDDQLVAGFLDRIEKEIDRRVDDRLAERGPRKRAASVLHPGNLALCIPIIAIAGGIGHLAGLIAAFIALAVVFIYAESRR
ncbi:MAG TPA: hypothetical protein VH108_00420 [Gaiellaceae bacterium]|nr:hypothetical protein [Gaiellaceae bacterium]